MQSTAAPRSSLSLGALTRTDLSTGAQSGQPDSGSLLLQEIRSFRVGNRSFVECDVGCHSAQSQSDDVSIVVVVEKGRCACMTSVGVEEEEVIFPNSQMLRGCHHAIIARLPPGHRLQQSMWCPLYIG